MTGDNYNWSEWNEHYWLAADRDRHVALVSCSDPHVFPSGALLDWRWLSGIDERLAEYFSGNPCRSISFTDLSDLLRRNGFFVIDSCRLGDESEIEFFDPLSTPVRLDGIPGSFRTIASFFALQKVSFLDHRPLASADWKSCAGVLPAAELLHLRRSIALNPSAHTMGNFMVHPMSPRAGTRVLEYRFLECRFLPDSNLVAESSLPTPHIACWERYFPCFRELAENLTSISGSDDLEFILRDGCRAKASFDKVENEPPLAIRCFHGESLAAELLLRYSPPNGLADNVGNGYAFALFASDDVKKQFANSVHEICRKMDICLSGFDDEVDTKSDGGIHIWHMLRNFF